MDDGKIIRFTRYDEIPPPMTEGEISPPMPTLTNAAVEVARAAYSAYFKAYLEDGVFGPFALTLRDIPWWRRLWWKLEPWVPHVHLGPCNHEDCQCTPSAG